MMTCGQEDHSLHRQNLPAGEQEANRPGEGTQVQGSCAPLPARVSVTQQSPDLTHMGIKPDQKWGKREKPGEMAEAESKKRKKKVGLGGKKRTSKKK